MISLNEVEGRLAALETVAAYVLYMAGRQHYGSGWPQRMEARISDAISRSTAGLSPGATTAAETSIRSIFAKSGDDSLWPANP